MSRSIAVAVLLPLAFASPAAAETPNAAAVLKELGFPDDALQSLLAGEFVTRKVKSTSERELAVGMAFLVKVPPKKLVSELHKGLLLSVDPDAHARGAIEGEGSLDDFRALALEGDQVKRYLNAKPGGDLNLSAAEIEAFRVLKGKPSPEESVRDQVRRTLLGRYRAYRSYGLDGLAPYERKNGKQTSAAEDLRGASEAASGMKKHVPAFYDVLTGYPKANASGLTENFHWMSYTAHGTPVFILTHAFSMAQGEAFAVCQRQFYVTGSYNDEQAVAGLLPVEEGTVMVYVNRTSTDQVTGFGGSSKRAIGDRVMASQLKKLFDNMKQAAVSQ